MTAQIAPTPGPPGEPVGTNRTALTISPDDLPARARSLLDKGYRVALIAGHEDIGGIGLHAVYLFTAADPDRRVELQVPVPRDRPAVPSLAGLSALAGRFEREMHDLFGIVTLGHPMPRRLVRHGHWPRGWYPMLAAAGEPPEFAGAEVSAPVDEAEVSLGPVRDGVTEPARFRLAVDGERVRSVSGRLWYAHKGIERMFHGRTPTRAVELTERISGDTAVGHTLAFCLAVEDANRHPVSPDVQRIRAVLLELERLYNHAADLGGLCGDAGHGVLDAQAQRVREELLRINDAVTGHRLLRGAVHPGGVIVRRLPDPARLASLAAEVASLVELALESSVVVDRFTGVAVLSAEQAAEHSALGFVARASGVTVDARHDHPFLPADLPRAYENTDGDVLARFLARAAEFADSVRLIAALTEDGFGYSVEPPLALRTERTTGVGIVEGWRGTIVHRVELSAEGTLTRAKIVDPSFVNWAALPLALTGIDVADFPLANRSFNLSLAGNDL
ncbi:MAG TPA: NADH-quinone oxidoreductase subunit C [Actinophytocola sp.]|jgi:Ni,Fe-hydrogenase III large subunit|nr:NADH-quinone oxidoreductase subunit C [Actinophytocola sp.]